MMPAGVGGGATRRELPASEASNLPWGTTMTRRILLLIGMAKKCGGLPIWGRTRTLHLGVVVVAPLAFQPCLNRFNESASVATLL